MKRFNSPLNSHLLTVFGIIALLTTQTLFSCRFNTSNHKKDFHNKSNKEFALYTPAGLLDKNEDFCFSPFLNDTVGYLIGTNYTTEEQLAKRWDLYSAVIYKTTNGGNDWKIIHKDLGEYKNGVLANNGFYLVKVKRNTEYYGLVDTSFIYFLNTSNDSLLLVRSLPHLVEGIYVSSNQKLFAITYNQKDTAMLVEIDVKNKKIRNCAQLSSFSFASGYIFKNIFCFRTLDKGYFYTIDLGTFIITKHLVKTGNAIDLIYSDSNKLYVAISDNDTNKVLVFNTQLNKEREVFVKSNATAVIHDMYINKGKWAIISEEIKAGYVVFHYYFSVDNGQSWMEENLPFPLVVNPAYFFGDMNCFIYSAGGQIQTNF